MTLTKSEREFIQVYRDADEEGKLFIFDMLICAATCGEDFLKDMQTVQGDRDAMIAVVSKWKAAVQECQSL